MHRVAAVTGASSGIGLACAAALCEKGYKVYALSRTEGPLAGAVFVRTDVTDPESVARAFARAGSTCSSTTRAREYPAPRSLQTRRRRAPSST